MNSSPQPLGKISKTHGYNGILVLVSDQVLDNDLENLQEILIMVDGLPVPFPVKELTLRTESSAHVQLEFIDNQNNALELIGCDVYADIDSCKQEAGLEQWIGFAVHDKAHGNVGVICRIEDYKGNIVLQIMNGNKEILISLFPELITDINCDGKILHITAPDGYFE